jgi:hypothetical protein
MVVAAVGRSVARYLLLSAHRRAWVGCGLALAGLIVTSSVGRAVDVATAPRSSRVEVATADVLGQLKRQGVPSKGVILRVWGSNRPGLWGALINELDRQKAPVRVDKDLDYEFGVQRTASPRDVEAIWYVIDEGLGMSLLSGYPGADVIANASPLASNEEQELERLQRRLAVELGRAGRSDLLVALDSNLLALVVARTPGVDRSAVKRLMELNGRVARARGCRCGIVAFRPDFPGLPPVYKRSLMTPGAPALAGRAAVLVAGAHA